MAKELVHYERPVPEGDARKYIVTSCLKKRLNGFDPPYPVTSDTSKTTCPACREGTRWQADRAKFILYGE